MKDCLLKTMEIAFSIVSLLPLTGCFCGQFFRGSEDVVAVTISPANGSILPGATQNFAATRTFGGGGGTGDITMLTTWTSSDAGIATIDNTGRARGIRLGAVTISGTCQCYLSQTTLTVSSQVVSLTSVVITPATATVGVGLTQQFVATGTYSNGTTSVITSTAVWTSSDNTIATVNSAGLTTGMAAGNVTISATSGNVSGQTALTVQ
jgi:uncharacterized protein YjdB